MFSTILKEVTGILDRRFLMNLFFPSLVFWGLLIVIWFAGKRNLAAAATSWKNQETTLGAIEIVGYLAFVTLFSYWLDIQLTAILKLYEGYWDFPGGRRLKALSERRHRRRFSKLRRDSKLRTSEGSDPAQRAEMTDLRTSEESNYPTQLPERTKLRSYEELYFNYPPYRADMMPTRLGNILKNSEIYAYERYSIDSVLIWPRLYGLLPDRCSALVAQARSALDFMLVISSLGTAFAIVSGAYLLVVRADWWLYLVCFGGGMIVARASYQGAIGSALVFAQQIKAAFDLYRNELLKQMRIPLPLTRNGEDALWTAVCQFLYRNQPPTYPYSGP